MLTDQRIQARLVVCGSPSAGVTPAEVFRNVLGCSSSLDVVWLSARWVRPGDALETHLIFQVSLGMESHRELLTASFSSSLSHASVRGLGRFLAASSGACSVLLLAGSCEMRSSQVHTLARSLTNSLVSGVSAGFTALLVLVVVG